MASETKPGPTSEVRTCATCRLWPGGRVSRHCAGCAGSAHRIGWVSRDEPSISVPQVPPATPRCLYSPFEGAPRLLLEGQTGVQDWCRCTACQMALANTVTKHSVVKPVADAPASPLSVQVGGEHYKGRGIQPVEFSHANGLPFIEGSVVKYVTRWRDKGGLEDLKKARHYLDLLIELEERPTRPPFDPVRA